LLLSLRGLTVTIAKEQRELGHLLVAEKQAKVTGFARSDGRSISERENDGAVQALNLTVDVFKVRASLEALKAERDYTETALRVALALQDA
jgi:hypothetical protein